MTAETPLTITDIATAFSRHEFAVAEPYIAEDIEWTLVGTATLVGKAEVIAACEQAALDLAEVSTEFSRFSVVANDEAAAVETVAEYVDAAGDKSTVASSDFYDFVDGRLTGIRSYNLEI